MAPNTSSVFNEAPPQPQQPESKPEGVLVAPPPQVPSSASSAVAASVAVSSASALDASSVVASSVSSAVSAAAVGAGVVVSLSSSSVPSTATSSAMASSASSVATSSASMASTLRVDECVSSCFRRRRRQLSEAASERLSELEEEDACVAEDERAAAALAASERLFQQQLQMSRFARVSPAALDGIKPSLGFRKSCLKRSNSELPADLSALKREAAALCGSAPVVSPAPTEPERPVQKNRRRCWECKAKIGLTAVTCRCDYTFCNKHRYAEEHKCSFDFKVSAKRKLEDENPRVVPSKVARIN